MFCFVLNAKPAALKRLVAYDYINNNTFNFSWLATVITFNKSFFFGLLIILFQFLMFMMNLQGEPKGLSIGGLTVITKSLSLTVKYIDLLFCNN